jgi:hypothetical protein
MAHVFIQSASDYFGFGLAGLSGYLSQCPLLVRLNVDLLANHSHASLYITLYIVAI